MVRGKGRTRLTSLGLLCPVTYVPLNIPGFHNLVALSP